MLASGPIDAALRELRAGLRAAPPCESGDDEGSREWRVLADLARTGGVVLDGPISAETGGREHDLEFIPDLSRWRKLTKPPNAGYFVDLEDEAQPMMLAGTPSTYLTRLVLAAELFGDDIAFHGVHERRLAVGRELRIVTSQRHIDGDAATWESIHAWLAGSGYACVSRGMLGGYDAETWRRDTTWLFDVRPANVVQSGDRVIPIDIICQRT